MTRIVCISDTHTRHQFKIPDGDLLIHCGDLTFRGSLEEITKEAQWLKAIRIGGGFKDAVLVAGNHDWMAERDPSMMRLLIEGAGWTYLDHQPATIQKLRFFGSGWSPEFCNWALGYKRGKEAVAKWAVIPDDTQVLITHGPPKGRMDVVHEPDESEYSTIYGGGVRWKEIRVGCGDLTRRIQELKELKLHTFGHIHVHGGNVEKGADGVTYANAAIVNERYDEANKPIVFDIKDGVVTEVK